MQLVELIARWITDAPKTIAVGMVGLLIAAVAAIATLGVPSDFSPQALFTTFEEQQVIDERFEAVFGETENVALYMVTADDVLTPDALAYIHALSLAHVGAPFVDRIESVTVSSIPRGGEEGELLVDSPVEGDTVDASEVAALRAALEDSTILDGTLLSESRQTAMVAVFLKPGYGDIAPLREAMAPIYALAETLPPPAGVEVEVAGIPHIRVYVAHKLIADQAVLIPISSVLCLALLFVAFRWWPGTLLPAMAVGLSLIVALAGMAVFHEPLNIINNILPVLMIVIGISDAIHIVSRYGEESSATTDRKAATRRTVATMLAACFLTSFTTAIGFASLIVSHTSILRRFGVTCAIAVMAAYVISILLLPTALQLVSRPPQTLSAARDGLMERIAVRLVRFSITYPRMVVGVSALTLVGALVLGSRVPVDTFLMESFPEGSEIWEQNALLEREMNGLLPMELSLVSEESGRFDDPELLNAIDRVQVWLRARPEVMGTRSYGELLREAWVAYTGDASKRDAPFASRAQVAQLASLLEGGQPNPLDPWVTFDRRHLRVQVQVADVGSRAAMALVADLEPVLAAELGGFSDVQIELTGDAYSASRGLNSLISDMLSSLLLAIVFIFVILTLLFRSLQLGILSVPANVTPLAITLAYMALTGEHLNTTTVIIFSVSIGLAVDDTIHILARFREEVRDGYGVDDALLRTGRGAGRAILVTSAMLVSGLSVILLSSFVPVRLFAELTAVTIAGCIVGDLVLLPALLKLFWRRPKNIAPVDASRSSAAV